MLGFAPISGQAISGSPFKLTAIIAELAGTVAITFGVTGTPGLFSPISGTASITFGATATASARVAIAGTAAITFGGSGNLTVAGYPIIVTALADSFTVRADRISFETTAMADSYTTRGSRGQ